MTFFDQEVEALIRAYSTKEGSGRRQARGARQIRERVEAVAGLCAKRLPGDLIEIGCYVGETTVKLAGVAEEYDRRVIAVDPWEKHTQNCSGGEYKEFLSRIAPYKEIVDVVRAKSQSQEAIRLIKKRKLCFAFVDGLHRYSAVKSDLDTVSHCAGVIAVDDLLWCNGIDAAFSEFKARRKIRYDHIREGYIVIP